LHLGPRDLGFVGAVCELAALVLVLVNQARDARSQSDTLRSAAPNTALE
jgi:hypothetical protein